MNLGTKTSKNNANSKDGTINDEYAHLKESTEFFTAARSPRHDEELEPTQPLTSMDL